MQPFLSGVVEGFYGRPWTTTQRKRLFDWLVDAGLNTYFYAPKDDVHHRAIWREPYSESDLASLKSLVGTCEAQGLRFIYGLGPGLDLSYSDSEDRACLKTRFSQLLEIGVSGFGLLFDDIPDAMKAEDQCAFASFAAAQAHLTNDLLAWFKVQVSEPLLLFCPTPYCGRMDSACLGGAGYLDELGKLLDPAIPIFWTGPEIISFEISDSHSETIADRLRRSPLIWDNLQANDYDLRRLFLGPYGRRPNEPQQALSGILLNPNCEFEANFVPIHTLGAYLRPDRPTREVAYEQALAAWLPAFEGSGEPWDQSDLRLLADIFFLPDEHGRQATALLDTIALIFSLSPDQWGQGYEKFQTIRSRVESIAVKLTELKNRDLFYTFNRQWWDLREELQLLDQYFAWKITGTDDAFTPPDHLPHTFRGGMLAAVQGFLRMKDDGTVDAS
ncbi:MAG: beta-N-acetylglucosaminidase domain-containing protein [Verrucomicrobiota bacterium]